MNAFTGMTHLEVSHFHDMEKNATAERVNQYETEYKEYIQSIFCKGEVYSSELRNFKNEKGSNYRNHWLYRRFCS